MRRAPRLPAPVTILAALALFVALSGSVYAAAKIDGTTIRPNSLPGNRVVVGSLPPNRLQEGSIPGNRLAPGSVTGTQVDSSTLDTVPSAVRAETADSAHNAATALRAESAGNAERLGGRRAGCTGGTKEFAGACWQKFDSEATATAPVAAASCAAQGGELPGALALAAFAMQPDIELAPGDEWSGDVTNVSGLDAYAVVTVTTAAKLNRALPTEPRKYRCVFPLIR
jgi:hypothetical protein